MPVEHNLSRSVTSPATHGGAIATLAGQPLLPNTGIPLNLDWVREVRVNTSAVERRAQSQVARRTVKKEWQAAWLLRAITCMDLTTLSGDDTDERVRRLCAKGRHPIQAALEQKLGIEGLGIKVAAICVYHTFVETALRALEGSGIHVAAVSTGFPAGLSPLAERVNEIRRSVEAGAHEIDIVITRSHVFGGRWQALYDEVATFKQACGSAHMKVDPRHRRSTDTAQRRAGERRGHDGGRGLHQDFNRKRANERDLAGRLGHDPRDSRIRAANRDGRRVQTGGRNPNGEAVHRLAGHDQRRTGRVVAAVGDVSVWSQRLAGDIERQLEHHATGRYSAEYRHPLA